MSWASRHPSEVPSTAWDSWLDPRRPVSPYLNPRWALFWERRWKDAGAELWCHGDPGYPSVAILGVRRRQTFGDRFHVLPFGTTGGFLGEVPEGETLATLAASLWQKLVGPRTVEITLNLAPPVLPTSDWRTAAIDSPHWILDTSSPSSETLDSLYSESHRRNIRKGEDLGAALLSIATGDDARHLITAWGAPSRHHSRIVLDSVAGPLLAGVYQGNHAMVWRTAWIAERPRATCLWLVNGALAVYVDGGVSRDRDTPGINHFLFDRVLKELRSRGVTRFDFGAGPAGATSEGLAQFKEGWGAKPVEHRELVLRRPWYHSLRSLF